MRMEKGELLRLSKENLEWFNENYSGLKKKYDNQWIVIENKAVVANASTYDQLLEVLKNKDKKSAVIEFIDSKKLAMFF